MAGRIIPPWTPTVVGSMDTSQFDLEFTSMLPVGEYNRVGQGEGGREIERDEERGILNGGECEIEYERA